MKKIDETVTLEAAITLDGAPVDVTVEVEVEGEYHRATWGRDGGSPEEFPEATILRVTTTDEDGQEISIPVKKLSEMDARRIEGRAIDLAMGGS